MQVKRSIKLFACITKICYTPSSFVVYEFCDSGTTDIPNLYYYCHCEYSLIKIQDYFGKGNVRNSQGITISNTIKYYITYSFLHRSLPKNNCFEDS